jgi:hypothetical protein
MNTFRSKTCIVSPWMRNGHLLEYIISNNATSAIINQLVCSHAPLAIHIVIFCSFLKLLKE